MVAGTSRLSLDGSLWLDPLLHDGMGESTTCKWCGSSIDPNRDHHFSLSHTSIDVRDSQKETDKRLLCKECGDRYLDVTSKSKPVEADPLDPNE